MINYFLYRINASYDGFTPERLPERMSRGMLDYNWSAYVESLDPGDIILTYFTGAGVEPGIYAVTVIRTIDLSLTAGSVRARVLDYRENAPLLPVRGSEALFNRICTRRRGAEVVVPMRENGAVYRHLEDCPDLIAEARIRNVELPGARLRPVRRLTDIPRIDLRHDLRPHLRSRLFAPAFWIRPSQASWITHAPDWLWFISSAFRAFKAGDLSHVRFFSRALAVQLRRRFRRRVGEIGAVAGVPLSADKRDAGEVDRVHAVAKEIARELGVPCANALSLSGRVSRRRYKNLGRTAERFQRDYLDALTIRSTRPLASCVRDGKAVLLVDDVYTDGVTLDTIQGAMAEHLGAGARFVNATVGLMAKKWNMDPDLFRSWKA